MNLFSRLFGDTVPQLPPDEVKNRLKEKPSPFLLDVRQPEEYRQGHIAGARLVPLGQLSQNIKQLPKDREIICICRSGSRSRSAVQQLNAAGFRASNLQGGMIAWGRAGHPMQPGKGRK